MRLRERLRAARPPGPRVLVVAAVEPESLAIGRGLGLAGDDRIAVEVIGVGPAAAAATTARLLARAEADGSAYDLVVCMGIAGGFVDRAPAGAMVLARRTVAADLGADSPDGFLPLETLGIGASTVECDADALAVLRERLPAAIVGDILTVSTVTGTAERAAELAARHPDAVAEAMEGFGAATAARQAGAAYAEVRTIANPVGPRDRGAWRIDEAFAALAVAASGLPAILTLGQPGSLGP
jgi:futalosine hydrolase